MRSLRSGKNLPQAVDLPRILNSHTLLKPLKIRSTSSDFVKKDLKFSGLKKVIVAPYVEKRLVKISEEREKAMRMLREKIIRQIGEKSRLVREKATRKTKQVIF